MIPVDTEPSLALLPTHLQLDGTTFSRIAAGQSGAAVHRVSGPAGSFILKITSPAEPLAAWERAVEWQRAAAERGVAPQVLHADAGARAVLSEQLIDQGFAPFFHNPVTQPAAIALLGDTVKRLHSIPMPADATLADAAGVLRQMYSAATATGPLPAWVHTNVDAVLATPAPASDRAPVVSHNDLNPSNLIYDGARLALLDWQTASAHDPYYDLATICVFLRMEDASCCALLSAYAGTAVQTLPPRFVWSRWMVGTLAGTALLHVARLRGFADQPGDSDDAAPTLRDVYGAMREGTLTMATGEGQWRLGVALMRSSLPPAPAA